MLQLSYATRSVWGTCPVCGAKNGHKCSETGGSAAVTLDGKTHIARIQKAPRAIEDNQLSIDVVLAIPRQQVA